MRRKNLGKMTVILLVLMMVVVGCGQANNGASADQNNGTSGQATDQPVSTEKESSPSEPEKSAVKYPEKPIELIIPFAAGANTDLIGRIVTSGVEKRLKKPIVVLNVPGASSAIGMTQAAKAAADGYTLVMTPSAPITINPQLKKVEYSPDSFVGVANIFSAPQVLVVPADAPYQNFEEWKEYVKQNPGKFTYGTTGTGNLHHVGMLKIANKFDLDMVQVPYDNAAETKKAILSKDVGGIVISDGGVADEVENGTLRVIVHVTDIKGVFPDKPLIKDFGVEGVNFFTGILAPKGTPDEIVQILTTAIKETLEDPETKGQLEKMDVNIDFKDQEEYYSMVKNEFKANGEVLKSIGLIK